MSNLPKNLRVLVVEDETIIAINICNSLQQFGYTTEFANSGEQALEYIKNSEVDVILMDIMLGDGMDGIETSKKIQAIKEIPVIYLTAYSDQGTLDRAQITEPSGYIIKPFHARELFITIELAIYKFQSARSIQEMQSRLYESQKMESIGLLSSGIAHEINNPLMGIVNFSLMGQELATKISDPEISHYFEIISQESEKIARIVKNLVSYSRQDRDHWVWSDLNTILEEILSFFNQLFIKENIHLDWNRVDGIPMNYCKPQKLKQAILNLISFCRVSCLESQTGNPRWIHIEIHKTHDSKGRDAIFLQISDSGNGIRDFIQDSESKEKNPYVKNFSLPGLGFHFSQMIAHEHEGEILVEDLPNEKALRMVLPLHPEGKNTL